LFIATIATLVEAEALRGVERLAQRALRLLVQAHLERDVPGAPLLHARAPEIARLGERAGRRLDGRAGRAEVPADDRAPRARALLPRDGRGLRLVADRVDPGEQPVRERVAPRDRELHDGARERDRLGGPRVGARLLGEDALGHLLEALVIAPRAERRRRDPRRREPRPAPSG
jgi:hypothetical protein